MGPANGNRPSHVCLVRDQLAWGGGAERVLIEQAETLVRRGVRCSIVVSAVSESARELVPDGVEVHVLGGGRYHDLAFLPRLLKLSRLLRKMTPTCVIAHQSLGDYLHWALKGTRIPYLLLRYESIFYMPGDTIKYSFRHRKSFHRIRESMAAYLEAVPERLRLSPARRLLNEYLALRDWWAVRGARDVFTLTPRSRWELEQLYGVDAIVWTPGSNMAHGLPAPDDATILELRTRYGIAGGQPVILSANRHDIRKRNHVLIEAIRILATRGLSVKLILVGEGEERAGLERQVIEAGLDEQVVFAGFVSEESLAQHYYMCDLAAAIMWGSWALSIVEPLLYDKKVLISDEVPDLLSGVPNVFRTAPAAASVADAVAKALSTPAGSSADMVKADLDWDGQMGRLLGRMLPRHEEMEPPGVEVARGGQRAR